MQEQVAQVIYYARGSLKHIRAVLIIAWMICLSGWSYVFTMPNKYVSEAKVHVETRTMLQPLLQGMTIQSDTVGLLRIMQVLMFTRNNLEQIIKMSDLNKNSDGTNQSALIEKLKKDIKIEGGRDDIFTIKYETTSATLAKNVVQAVLTVFSEQTHQSTLSGTSVAKKFIDDQIKEYETRLRNAEQAKENFKRANLGLLPGEGQAINQAQNTANLLEDAKLQLSEALSKQKTLSDQLNNIKNSNENWSAPDFKGDLKEEDSRIEKLNEKKRELLLRFTDNHPEIVSLNNKIKELKESLKKDEKKNTTDDMFVKPNVMANPYVQTVKVALNEADAAVASAKARVEQLTMRLDKINNEMQARLTVETGLQNLNRDYDAIKKNYEQLLESREQASMSEKVDDQAEALKFKIADAPNTPLKPSSPKRSILYSALLVVGFVCGFGLSLLIFLLKPTIMSVSQLGQITGLPVLGGVSMKVNPGELMKNKKDSILHICAAVGLVLIYLGFMVADIFEINSGTLVGLFHRVS